MISLRRQIEQEVGKVAISIVLPKTKRKLTRGKYLVNVKFELVVNDTKGYLDDTQFNGRSLEVHRLGTDARDLLERISIQLKDDLLLALQDGAEDICDDTDEDDDGSPFRKGRKK